MAWTTKSYDALALQLATAQQEKARLEGENKALKQTVELLQNALKVADREETIGKLKARVAELEAEMRQCLNRATAPPPVPVWNGPGRG